MISIILIREINNKINKINEYITIIIYIRDIINSVIKTTCFTIKIHIINNLGANILININTITL